MSKKNWLQLYIAIGIFTIPIFFQNCSASHDEGSGMFASRIYQGSSTCDPILIQAYEDYKNALGTQALCLNCHSNGGSSGKYFAAPDMDIAWPAFRDEGEEKIWSFALNPGHKAGFTGPQNEPILAPHRATYQAAESEYATCIADSGVDDIPAADGLPTPTIRSANVVIPDAADILDNAQELSFTVNGYNITMEIASWETAQGNTGYDISLPSITAGNEAVYVKNMGVYLNDTIIPAPAGSAFQNVDRYVASGTTRTLFQSGVMNVSFATAGTNNIAVAFEVIEAAPNMDFTPATYNDLVNGVFATNCAGCHNATNPRGGISLANGSYTTNSLMGLFRAFDEDSQLWQSVNLGRMPPAGPLAPADAELIRGWILDGAPAN